MDASGFDGTNIYVDPAAFCGVAARMLAAGGRDSVPALLTLLSQALSADVDLMEAGSTRAAIPRPRLHRAAPDVIGLDVPAPIDLPVRARDTVLAVLAIQPSPDGLPDAWTVSPGPLGTIADLLALALSANGGSEDISDVQAATQTWLALDEADRADVAGELHDGLVQSLVAARYLLDLAATTWPGGPMPWLEAVRESLAAALVDGRTLLSTVQPRTRNGRGLRVALEDLCAGYRVPVSIQVAEAAPDAFTPPTPVMNAAGYRFVQAALADLVHRGADAAEVRFACGPGGMSIDVCAVGDRPAWPDDPGESIQRWATRIEFLGGTVLLQPAAAYLRFGPADEEAKRQSQDVHAGRAM